MVFGEFEWSTERLINHQVNVNLLGTMKFTNAMCQLLRQYKGRLTNILNENMTIHKSFEMIQKQSQHAPKVSWNNN